MEAAYRRKRRRRDRDADARRIHRQLQGECALHGVRRMGREVCDAWTAALVRFHGRQGVAGDGEARLRMGDVKVRAWQALACGGRAVQRADELLRPRAGCLALAEDGRQEVPRLRRMDRRRPRQEPRGAGDIPLCGAEDSACQVQAREERNQVIREDELLPGNSRLLRGNGRQAAS